MAKHNPAPMMQIGGTLKGSLRAASKAVIDVASCSGDPKVTIEALRTLARLAETKNVTVTNCTFTNHRQPADTSVAAVHVAPAYDPDGDYPPI